ncbi:hypothetical protein FK514_28870, partial [Klebsiella pneumoniae]|nr:hypothetical protein [Klebsiella pneumoniae]
MISWIHITFEREALANWLEKGGEIRGKLNGIDELVKLIDDIQLANLLESDAWKTNQTLFSVPAALRHQPCRI